MNTSKPVHAVQINVGGEWRTVSVTSKGEARAEANQIDAGNFYGTETRVMFFASEREAWA
jgi:hypothetical protein